MKVVVTGATGFLGNHTVSALSDAGHCVIGLGRKEPAPSRRVEGVLYRTGVDVGDVDTLAPGSFEGAEAVVHLVGIIQERGSDQTFGRIHVDGTRNVLARAKEAGSVRKFVYISAIGADGDAPSEYSQTKAQAERLVRESGLPFTILRPSIILGEDGEFVSQIGDLVRSGGLPVKLPFPVIPVPGSGRNLFQPIYVDDLTACITAAVKPGIAVGQAVEVGGANQVSFNGLLDGFAHHLGVRKPKMHVPVPIMMLVAPLMGILPNPPVTRDQLKNLSRDNICDLTAMRETFGIDPIGFDEALNKVFAA